MSNFSPRASAQELEDYLLRQRSPELSGLNFPDQFVLPDYNLSIANLPATFAALLDAELTDALPALPKACWAELAPGLQRVVWVVLDAVGWLRFRGLLETGGALAFSRLAEDGRLFPITSVFPSTTTTALACLWTGYSPAQHGLVGSDLYLPEFGMVVDTLGFCPAGEPRRDQLVKRGLEPEAFLPVPGLAKRLAEQGVTTRVLIHSELRNTGLSRLYFRGVSKVERFITSADMWVGLRQQLAQHLDKRLLLVGYWAYVDSISHYHGPDSEAWQAEVRNLAFSLEREFLNELSPQERKGTLLVITADHGHISGAPESRVPLAEHSGLAEHLLMPPTGGPRSAYLTALPGHLDTLRHYLEAHLADRFYIIDSEAALNAGLLGPGQPTTESRYRVGDLMVLGRDHYMLDRYERERPLLGMHGGLSEWEMLAPLLLTRLD
jgi:hypothetical protein